MPVPENDRMTQRYRGGGSDPARPRAPWRTADRAGRDAAPGGRRPRRFVDRRQCIEPAGRAEAVAKPCASGLYCSVSVF